MMAIFFTVRHSDGAIAGRAGTRKSVAAYQSNYTYARSYFGKIPCVGSGQADRFRADGLSKPVPFLPLFRGLRRGGDSCNLFASNRLRRWGPRQSNDPAEPISNV